MEPCRAGTAKYRGLTVHLIHVNDGVPWYEAPKPRWWHRCKPWTVGVIDGIGYQRCACGGIRTGRYGGWDERNTRKKRR